MVQPLEMVVSEPGRTRVTGVAARQLGSQLTGVWRLLREVCRGRHDPRRLHQVRVSVRRTLATLEAFGELAPARQVRWFARRLRRIRRAAGETRDLDVLVARLVEESPLGDGPQGRRLVAQITRHRDKSRRPLRKLFRTLEADDWPGRVARLRRRLRNLETDETFAAFAGRRLPSFLERFFARADRRLADADELHSLRVAGKKLRYGLEVLGVALPRAVRTAGIAVLTEMQESLGGFVDHATAADRFHRWARKSDAGSHRRMLASLAEREARMADKARRRFVRWWTSSRRRSLRRSFQPTSRRTMT